MNTTDLQPGGIVDRLLSEADKLYQMGRVQPAVDILLQTIGQYPGDRRAYDAFAGILIDGYQFENGLALLQKIPDTDRNQRTLELRARCLIGLDRLGEAEGCTRKILADNSSSAAGLTLMGQLAYQHGNTAEAENYFNQAIESDPDYAPALVNLGSMHWERGQQKVGLDLIEKGFSRHPLELTTATAYHTAATELGAYERSEDVFTAAVKSFPYNERLQHLLIDILLKQQKYPVALSEIQRALAVFGASDGILAAAEKVKALAGEGTIEDAARNECSLSVCLIVKNEDPHLAKCLLSIKPVADEIIVVDTGSTDHSKAIAVLFGAHVFDFKWVDDFAKAKNYAISKASGDWILSLDADEVISPLNQGALRKLVDKTAPKDVAYSIVTRNYMNRVNALGWSPNDGKYPNEEAGYGWFPSEKVRLFPNQEGICFEYPVHEMVEPSLARLGINILPSDIPVHHYGKLDGANCAAKGRRYYRIGINKLAEMEHSVGAIRELAIQAANLQKYEEAVFLWQKAIGLQPEMADAFVNMGTAYWNLGKYREAAVSAQKAMELAPNLKEARFNYSLSLLHLGEAAAAIPVLESLLKKIPDYLAARFLLAAVQCCTGESKKAAQGFKNLKQSKLGPGLSISCQTLAQGLRSAGHSEYAKAILNAVRRTDIANEEGLSPFNICRDTP